MKTIQTATRVGQQISDLQAEGKITKSGASSPARPDDPRRHSSNSGLTSDALKALRNFDDPIDPILEESGEEDMPSALHKHMPDDTSDLVGPNKQARDTIIEQQFWGKIESGLCLLYTSPSPRDKRQSRMPSSA